MFKMMPSKAPILKLLVLQTFLCEIELSFFSLLRKPVTKYLESNWLGNFSCISNFEQCLVCCIRLHQKNYGCSSTSQLCIFTVLFQPQYVCQNKTSKVSIITIGTWYKALWSPNLTWNHNKKVFHLFFWNFSFQKLHTHLFSGNNRNRATKVNKNSKVVKIYFFKPKVIKMYFFNQKMVEHQNIPMSFNFSDPGAYITYLMLLYLPWSIIPRISLCIRLGFGLRLSYR